MATLDTLVVDQKLHRITVPLGRKESHERLIYGSPEALRWMREDVPVMTTGRLRAAQTPFEQLDSILHRWTAGYPIRYRTHLFDLMPGSDETWELKTVDLRIFGWIYRPQIFIAVCGGYADWYKPPDKKLNYEDDRRLILRERAALDLDEPKFVKGMFHELV